MLYSGKLIRNIRTAENIKLTTLARGLCSIGQLARIENGDRSAEKLLFDSLYERLGKLTSVNKANNPKCVDCWAVNFCKDCNWNMYKEGIRDCKARLQIIQKRLLYVYNMEEMECKRLETVMKG